MAKLSVDVIENKLIGDGQKVTCLICGDAAELKERRLTRSDFLYWWQGGSIVLCRECFCGIVPSMLADTVSTGEEERALAEFRAQFWRARAHIEAGDRKRSSDRRDPD